LFWQIENVFILKPTVNTFKKIWESFVDINLNRETGISNKDIIFQNFFDNEEKNIQTDNFIFLIKYNYILNSKDFLNYIWKIYLRKKENIFTKKTDWFWVFSLVIFIFFLIFIFFAIFWFFSINQSRIIWTILGITFLFWFWIYLINYAMRNKK